MRYCTSFSIKMYCFQLQNCVCCITLLEFSPFQVEKTTLPTFYCFDWLKSKWYRCEIDISRLILLESYLKLLLHNILKKNCPSFLTALNRTGHDQTLFYPFERFQLRTNAQENFENAQKIIKSVNFFSFKREDALSRQSHN